MRSAQRRHVRALLSAPISVPYGDDAGNQTRLLAHAVVAAADRTGRQRGSPVRGRGLAACSRCARCRRVLLNRLRACVRTAVIHPCLRRAAARCGLRQPGVDLQPAHRIGSHRHGFLGRVFVSRAQQDVRQRTGCAARRTHRPTSAAAAGSTRARHRVRGPAPRRTCPAPLSRVVTRPTPARTCLSLPRRTRARKGALTRGPDGQTLARRGPGAAERPQVRRDGDAAGLAIHSMGSRGGIASSRCAVDRFVD